MDTTETIKNEINEINKSFPKFYFFPSVIREENNDPAKLEQTLIKFKKRTLPSGFVVFTILLSMIIAISSHFELISFDGKGGLFIFLTLTFCVSYYRAKKVQFLLKQKIALLKFLNSK